ncbi:MAG: FtsX-like permease family protein [Burkholderiales bacterium]|nr:FtsX-like permease family protein [Burkholderiales bacterium]
MAQGDDSAGATLNPVGEIALAGRLLVRDWRAGEVTLLAAAIVIAVAAVTTVGFFTSRVDRALAAQANRLLGADLVIGDTRALAPELRREALRRGLAAVEVLRFPSMMLRGEKSMLADVKVVGRGYPARGEVRIADRLFAPDRRADGIPAPGTVWVDERLYTGLELAGDARVALGNREFRVAAVITQEPGVALGFLSGQPRVMMNLADLAATGLVQPGSRVRYSLQLAGEPAAVAAYRAWSQARGAGERIEGMQDARPGIRSALDRAGSFLNLAALATVLLAAAAVVLAARRYLQRHLDGCAVMRCLGASQGTIVRLYVALFVTLGLVAASCGVAIGMAAQAMLAYWLTQVAAVPLPAPGPAPVLAGAAVGLLLLLGFALPPLGALARVPTLRVMRRELGAPKGGGLAGYAAGAAVVCALILWRAGEFRLGITVLGWSVAVVAAAAGLAGAVLAAVGRVRGRGAAWRFGLAGLHRQRLGTVVQVVALGLGMMALLALTLVRADLLRSWRASLPPGAPNRFVINIAPDQVEPMRAFFAERGLAPPELYPMVRGRLTGIGERAVSEEDYTDERARRLVNREFNLSWAKRLRGDNRIVAGRWWEAGSARTDELSVERGLAGTLGIRLGDRLTFDIAGARVAATVTSLRAVEWDSFNVNFFVIGPPGLYDDRPATWVTSFFLPPERAGELTVLVKRFPTVVLIDVAQALVQVQALMDRAARAVQFVFLFTLVAGLVVLYAAVASTRDERLYEASIMRTLGATRAQVNRAHLAEFAVIGAAAGLVAAAGASGLGWYIARRFLDLDYAPDPAVWLIGVAGGAAGVAVAGWIGTRRVLEVPPLHVLRSM